MGGNLRAVSPLRLRVNCEILTESNKKMEVRNKVGSYKDIV